MAFLNTWAYLDIKVGNQGSFDVPFVVFFYQNSLLPVSLVGHTFSVQFYSARLGSFDAIWV